MTEMRKLALFAAAALAAAVVAVVPAQARPSKTVKVGNDFFSPRKLSIKKGTRVTWKWVEGGVDHNVTPLSGTRGSKDSSRKGHKVSKIFRKKGTFKYICTIHPDEMRITIKVK